MSTWYAVISHAEKKDPKETYPHHRGDYEPALAAEVEV
jgi:hypothetical protein